MSQRSDFKALLRPDCRSSYENKETTTTAAHHGFVFPGYPSTQRAYRCLGVYSWGRRPLPIAVQPLLLQSPPYQKRLRSHSFDLLPAFVTGALIRNTPVSLSRA
jgi:hypothetical protein